MSLAVELRDIRKYFGAREVLKGISCAFPAGKVSVLLGPNGSGKTTLMRVVARLESPGSGSVVYSTGGEAVRPGLDLMRKMTLVAQGPVLFNTTVYNNVAYGLRLRGLAPAEVRRRVEEALAIGGLERLAHARAGTLSGGEAQRAAIVRAYALRPDLVLLDEPAANLDPEGVALAEGVVRRMVEDYGATAVMVTHNLFQARRLADTVFFIYGGRLVESGRKEEFFVSPKEDLTRKFISGEVVY